VGRNESVVDSAIDTGHRQDRVERRLLDSVRSKGALHARGRHGRAIEIETSEPAKLQVMLSPDTPIQESWGSRFSFVERSVSCQGLVTKWTGHLGQLRPCTRYHVT